MEMSSSNCNFDCNFAQFQYKYVPIVTTCHYLAIIYCSLHYMALTKQICTVLRTERPIIINIGPGVGTTRPYNKPLLLVRRLG